MSTASVLLLTGLPGNGKTLHAICIVKEMAEREQMPVYYSGIDILDESALPWHKVDPLKWFETPERSIVVIDECWKTFPLRPNGATVPVHLERVATVRHGGRILVLITQHPSQIDLFVRRLVGRHLHHVRRFGMQACAVFEWPQVKDNCDKTRKDALQSEWSYKKEAYAWYKSAEAHTFKRKLPAKLLWLVAAVVAVPVAIWFVIHLYQKQRDASYINQAIASAGGASGASSPSGQYGGGHVKTKREYLADYTPRFTGLVHTAPAYDEVVKPVRAPYPAACVQTKNRCQCYTQQATKLDVPKDLCEGIVSGGFFVAWDEKRGERIEVNKPPALAPVGTREPSLGMINATPGWTPANSRPLADQVADGQNLRHGKNNRIPG